MITCKCLINSFENNDFLRKKSSEYKLHNLIYYIGTGIYDYNIYNLFIIYSY